MDSSFWGKKQNYFIFIVASFTPVQKNLKHFSKKGQKSTGMRTVKNMFFLFLIFFEWT